MCVVVDEEDDPIALVLELPGQPRDQVHDRVPEPLQVLLQLIVLQRTCSYCVHTSQGVVNDLRFLKTLLMLAVLRSQFEHDGLSRPLGRSRPIYTKADWPMQITTWRQSPLCRLTSGANDFCAKASQDMAG